MPVTSLAVGVRMEEWVGETVGHGWAGVTSAYLEWRRQAPGGVQNVVNASHGVDA